MPDPGPDSFSRPTADADRNSYGRNPPVPPPGQPRRNIWPWVVAGVLASFLIGLLGSPWLEAEVRRYVPQPPASAELAQGGTAPEKQPEKLGSSPAVGLVAPADTLLADRIAALEAASTAQRTTDSDVSVELQALATELARVSDKATVGDERVRDMFLLTVMRRMVEAGRPLTALEAYIAARFRASDGAAVDALTAWSREPQTRRTLAARLPELGRVGEQADAQAAGSFWERLKAGLSGLITVREPVGGQTPGSADIVRAAAEALKNGELELAISEMAGGPQSPATRQWVRDGQLLLAAEVALDRLDSQALTLAVPVVEPKTAPPPVQPPLNAG